MDSNNENQEIDSSVENNSHYSLISQIKDIGSLRNTLRVKVDRVYTPFYNTGGMKIFKFLFSDISGSIVGLSQGTTGEELSDKLESRQTYEIGVSAGTVRNKGVKNHYDHHFEVWINCPAFVQQIDFPNLHLTSQDRHQYEVGSIEMIEEKMRLGLAERKIHTGFHIALEGVHFTSGNVYRYLGCQHCQKSIKSRNYAERFLCPKNCQNNFLPVERSIFYRITDIGISEGAEHLSPIANCFDREAEKILGRRATSFDNDSQSNLAFQEIIMSYNFNVLVTGFLNGCLHWELTLENICPFPIATIQPMEICTDDAQHFDAVPIIFQPQRDFYVVGFNTGLMDRPLEVSVTPRSTTRQQMIESEKDNGNEIYQMSSIPAGFVLIINNIEFPISQRRDGSEIDVLNLTTLFNLLGYTVIQKDNVSSRSLSDEFENFVEMFNTKPVDSCFVIVLSHGRSMEVEMSDGVYVDIYRHIIYIMADERNLRYRGLIGIPKVFIFATCQKFDVDPNAPTFPATSSTITSLGHTASDRFDGADWTICFSAAPDHMSHRSPEYGTYYIYVLVKCIMEEAGSNDLITIFANVEKTMTGRVPARNRDFIFDNDNSDRERMVQVSKCMPSMFNKFYFNVKVVNSD